MGAALLRVRDALRRDWQLWLLMLPALAYFLVFCYLPMYGIQIAFRDYKASAGIAGSDWVGLDNFRRFFGSYYWGRMVKNTLVLNVLVLLFGQPVPIMLALMLNQLRSRLVRTFAQASVIVPHFVSTVIMVGILQLFLSPTRGVVNLVLSAVVPGYAPVDFLLEASWFRPLYVLTDIWQNAGWNALIYTAALDAVDPVLYEAASLDGASRWQQVVHIDLPHLAPVIVVVLVLSCGTLMTTNVDKVLLMQTSGNIATSDLLGVYVYQVGLASSRAQYSYAAAIGLLQNSINFLMLLGVNAASRRLGQPGLV